VVTIDARRDFTPGCQVFAITSAADADSGYLARLTKPNGGVALQLGRQTETEILSRLRETAPRVVEARGEDGSKLGFATLDAGANGWLIVGEAPPEGGVILRVAGLTNGVEERRYDAVTARNEKFSGAGALWAADRVALLAAEDGAHQSLLSLSRRFSVASPALSFIVLEQPDDYVEAGIAPPANYPKEGMEAYREAKAESDRTKHEEAEQRLTDVVEAWEEQKEWWSTDYKPDLGAKAMLKRSQEGAVSAPAAAPAASAGEADMMEVAVTGLRASLPDGNGISASIGIALEEWDPGKPYIKALDAASAAEIDRVLAREEARNGSLPAFYFDVAEWLFRKKRGVEALEMLLSALDLPAANEETASMVADRLLRYGRMDRAIWLYERANGQSDYLPQPRRTLALALAKRAAVAQFSARPAAARADLRRAVELLNEIVVTPWEDGYDGIELVSLMEINNLLPRLVELGEQKIPLDARLRALLDVDIRVVIDWNTGATDMDLWVDEPGGERAIFNHPRTAIGGRLSNDMTQGFGPEEYLLRRAVPGEYRISVNVYASDAINPNGTTVVTAHLLRNFGRANQQEESMELELAPNEEGEKLIGRFTVN
jgi:tetratricopeptide (TPR) repeat protein